MSYNYLVELQKKNPAKQKKGFEIFFNNPKLKSTVSEKESEEKEASDISIESDTESPKKSESLPEPPTHKKIVEDPHVPEPPKKNTKINIIDKTKSSVIDREHILKRIKDAMSKKTSPLEKMAEIELEKSVSPPKLPSAPAVIKPIEPTQKIKIKIKKPKTTESKSEPQSDKESIILEPTEPVQKPKRGRPKTKIVTELTREDIVIDKKKLAERLPKMEKIKHRISSYYMNNRKLSIEKINQLFEPYRKELVENKESINCDSTSNSNEFKLLFHQKIILDYLNLYSPYRGLMLFYGLGAGKSCSSIAIAEGMKSDKKIFVMTPKSLKMNFFSELKKCGDPIFKKNQYWEFVSTTGHDNYVSLLSNALSLPKEYIEKNNGAWLVDVNKPSNYSELSSIQQKTLDDQLNAMIRTKYIDLNYNGLRMSNLKELTDDFTKNPFDHSVVIIDEAHNFVSRIVNKIKKPKSTSYVLYDLLLKATDVRIVLLTGTPIINYPNEIGILFNILRGYIKTWTFHLDVKTNQKVNRESILEMFEQSNLNTYDYVEYSGNKLIITRNPYGFINTKKQTRTRAVKAGKATTKSKKDDSKRKTKKNRRDDSLESSSDVTSEIQKYEESQLDTDTDQFRKDIYSNANAMSTPGMDETSYKYGGDAFEKYNGIKLDSTGNLSDNDFMRTIVKILKSNEIDVIEGATEIKLNKALPDDSDTFLNVFVDQESALLKNKNLFQKRILGLVSYFRSAQEKLLPSFIKTESSEKTSNTTYHIVESEMSSFQFEVYSKIRKEEREHEKSNKKKLKKAQTEEDLYNISSTYRIFSRACCNYAFPQPPGRPLPKIDEKVVMNESTLDATPANAIQENDSYADVDDEDNIDSPENKENIGNYNERIQQALNYLEEHSDECLSKDGLEIYSPKFLNILENLQDENNIGLHLIYSQFRTLEGIGILKLMLESNGFEQFQIKKTSDNEWTIIPPKDMDKPRFMLYTGTETEEEKEILRNIYNSQWEYVPMSIRRQLLEISDNNFTGDIVKIIMITASGAEGINLKNTRFVHIVEPYWNLVRLEQVIGRARRICSHQDLPEELRTIKVFLYITTLSEEQKTSDANKELIINDLSKLDKKTPVTTDESLFEIAQIKNNINQQLLNAIKETAIDCSLYSGTRDESYACYGFGKVNSNNFSYIPSFEEDQYQKEELNVGMQVIKGLIKVKVGNNEYAFDKKTNYLYDMESYQRAKTIPGENLILVGKIVVRDGKKTVEYI